MSQSCRIRTGWNEFSADPGNYDIKFQDIIEQETQIVVSSSPVVNATSVKPAGLCAVSHQMGVPKKNV